MHFPLRQFACLLLCVFALTACKSQDEENATRLQTVKGAAIKGVIANGVVSAYSVNEEAQTLSLLSSTHTDSAGKFVLQIPESALNSPVLMQITASSDGTTMRCDQALGCISESDGQWYGLGEALPLATDFQLLGLALASNGAYEAHISSLSHLIVATALNLPDGLTFANINQAENWVSDTLDLQTNPLTTSLIDLTDNDQLERGETNSIIISLLGASLFDLSQTQSWYDASITINEISPSSVFAKSAAIAQEISVNFEHDTQTQVDTLLARASSASSESAFQVLSSPESKSTNHGESFYFRVHAVSDSPIQYQWLHNGQEIVGATEAIYGKANAKLDDAGSYQVRVSSAGQTLFSSLATLYVNASEVSLAFSQQPQGKTLVSDQALALQVKTNINDNVEIRWQKNGSLLSGQKGPSLYISSAQASDTGAYRAIASRNGQIVYSNFANVYVNNALGGIQITEQPKSLVILQGQHASLSVEASGGGFLRYQWFKNGKELSNATSQQLLLANVSAENEGIYFVQISNSSGRVISSTAEVQVINPSAALDLLEHPRSAQLYIGDTHTLGVKTSAQTSHQYQWFKDGIAIPGANAENFTLTNVTGSNAGAYHVVVTNALGTLTSNKATITTRERPSLALSWAMPSERENGEPLSPGEIYGYRLEFGYSQHTIDQGVTVVGASNTQFTLSQLDAGFVYLHIATIDSDGITGRFSAPIEVFLP
jgi:hypothetical protein